MKTILLFTLFLTSLALSTTTHAQLAINASLATPAATQPWYNTDDNYYYLPEQGVYYNVSRKVYVYHDNDSWVAARKLPDSYNGYSYMHSHYIVLHQRAPFDSHDQYKTRYPETYRGPEGHGYTRSLRHGWR